MSLLLSKIWTRGDSTSPPVFLTKWQILNQLELHGHTCIWYIPHSDFQNHVQCTSTCTKFRPDVCTCTNVYTYVQIFAKKIFVISYDVNQQKFKGNTMNFDVAYMKQVF